MTKLGVCTEHDSRMELSLCIHLSKHVIKLICVYYLRMGSNYTEISIPNNLHACDFRATRKRLKRKAVLHYHFRRVVTKWPFPNGIVGVTCFLLAFHEPRKPNDMHVKSVPMLAWHFLATFDHNESEPRPKHKRLIPSLKVACNHCTIRSSFRFIWRNQKDITKAKHFLWCSKDD